MTTVGMPEMVPLAVLEAAGYSGSGIWGSPWDGESGGIWRGMSKLFMRIQSSLTSRYRASLKTRKLDQSERSGKNLL